MGAQRRTKMCDGDHRRSGAKAGNVTLVNIDVTYLKANSRT